MAVTTATVPARLADTLVIDTTTDNTSEDDVFSGSVTLYQVQINNSDNATAVYTKISDGSSATPSSTVPDFVFYTPGNKSVTYAISVGVSLATGVSFWGTTTQANGSAQTSPDPAPTVTLLGN
jgi:hypothetical protein